MLINARKKNPRGYAEYESGVGLHNFDFRAIQLSQMKRLKFKSKGLLRGTNLI